MRVALVASLVSPIRAAEANGPHSVIVDLARGLSARGHEAIVYAARGSVAESVTISQIDVDPVAQRAALQVGGRSSADARSALERGFRELFSAITREQPDVVSQHAFDAPAIQLSEHLPVIHTLHLPPVIPEVVAAVRATGRPLATVSNAARDAWAQAGVRGLTVLRNGVPDGAPPTGRVSNVALIAGRISPEKGTHTAVAAARRAGLTPLIAGDVYDTTYFETQVQPMLREGEFVGPVTRRRLSELMSRSTVLLMPVEWDEAFGLVAAEAQMAGCPVVGYRRGALPEVVREGIGGYLVDAGDADGLQAGIGATAELDRERIRSWAQANLGVGRMISDYEHVLLSLVATRPLAA